MLNQAARELLLVQSSDWPFLVTTGQAKDYAVKRFNEHVERFEAMCVHREIRWNVVSRANGAVDGAGIYGQPVSKRRLPFVQGSAGERGLGFSHQLCERATRANLAGC